ncbi:MAG: GNAT family N-acetyltransferase [Deltaproteobacteria bacterium]|nr:GNAT family N-acetyltransferase [Deltaproteobacteria bacterium]
MKHAHFPDISTTTMYSSPHAFLDRGGNPIMLRADVPELLDDLTRMYLAYQPRGTFSGLPPVADKACISWVKEIIETSIGLMAMSFEHLVVGHAALFPIRDGICELLIVVAPQKQHNGIGTQLLHSLIQMGYEVGFSQIWLSVEKSNFVALHLYNRCGFERLAFTDGAQVEMTLDLKQYSPTVTVKVGKVMNRGVILVNLHDSCKRVVELFLNHSVDVLPVVSDDGVLSGILSQSDLIFKPILQRKVCEIATQDVVFLHESCTIEHAIWLLQTKRLRCIPVVDDKHRVVGSISRRDILAHYFKTYEQSDKNK